MWNFGRRIFSLFLAIQMVLMFIPGLGTVGAVVPPTPVSVSPAEKHNVAIGNSFSINIDVTDVVKLYGYEADVTYDAAVLNATTVTQGALLGSGGFSSEGTINNTTGRIDNIFKTLLAGEPKNGSGTLCSVTFTVVSKGTSTIGLSGVKLSDASANLIPISLQNGSFENSIPPAAPTNVGLSSGLGYLNVSWDANSESDLAGYKVYWGTSSGVYSGNQDVGNTTSYQIPGLNDGTTYYVAIKAYDSMDNYSVYSDQVSGAPGNVKPTAVIDSITPASGNQGDSFTFLGHGSDPDGTVVAYEWKSDIDNVFATTEDATYALSPGNHTITYRVKDNNGDWSDPDSNFVAVNARPTAVIDSIDPNPSIETDAVTFDGHGSDPDGTISEHQWKDGTDVISTLASFSKSDLSVGSHSISYRVKDNKGMWSNPDTETLIINAAPTPNAPVITDPIDPTVTALSSMTVTGTSEANAAITIFNDGIQVATTTASGAGTWSKAGVALDEGLNTLTAKATNKYGVTSSASNQVRVTKDTIPPEPPIISSPASGIYKDTNFDFTGTAEIGSTVKLFDGATDKGTTTATGGIWSINVSGLGEGVHTFTAKAYDAMGNASGESNTKTLTIDLTAPQIVITAPANGATINSSDFTVNGTSDENGASVTVKLDGVVKGTATVSGGNWTFNLTGVNDGDRTILAEVQDQAGNKGSTSISVIVDTALPATPVITNPANNSLTNSTNITASGTADSGSTVTVFLDDVMRGSVTASSGQWSLPINGLTDKTYKLTAMATNAVGDSGLSTAVNFTIDTILPQTTLALDPATPNGDNGWYISAPNVVLTRNESGTTSYSWTSAAGPWTTYSGSFTAINGQTLYYYTVDSASNTEGVKSLLIEFDLDDQKPSSLITDPAGNTSVNGSSLLIKGTAADTPSGVSKVEIKIGDADWVPVTGQTSWEYNWSLGVDGAYSIKTRATDNAGNVETPSAGITVTVDNTAPSFPPRIDQPLSGSIKDSRQVTISGSNGELGGKVWVCYITDVNDPLNNHVELFKADVALDGTWSKEASFPADGAYVIGAKNLDAVGNIGESCSNWVNITIDTDAPNAPVITDPIDGTLTNSSTMTVRGSFSDQTESESSIKIMVYVDGNKAGEASIGDGGWNLDIGPLTDGLHALTAKAKDAAGNVSETSVTANVTVDTICGLSISEPTDGIFANTSPITVKGMAEAGGSLLLDSEIPVQIGDNGAFETQFALQEGSNTISLTFTDLAGNRCSKSVNVLYDINAPASINDLTAGTPTSSMIPLTWTAPSDGDSGALDKYDLRYSVLPIEHDADFVSATKASGLPSPSSPGSAESYQLKGLSTSTKYYAAIKTMDKAGNWSAMSNVAIATTNAVPSGGGGGGGATSAATSAGMLAGQVLDIFGNPVPLALITGDGSSATPGLDGKFLMSLPAGDHLVTYTAPGYDMQTQWLHINNDETTQAPTCILIRTGGLQIAQENLGSIFGRVLNNGHLPIPGTAIRINNVVIPANASGYFRFTLVHPGVYTIYYDAPGYIGQTQMIEVKAGQMTTCPTVLLCAALNGNPGVIKGKVVDRRNRALSGVTVRIDATVMMTNARGGFKFDQVMPGLYTIHYSKARYKSQTQIVQICEGMTKVCPTVILKK